MLSTNVEGARHAGLWLFYLMIGFVALSPIIGLQYSAILFAFVTPGIFLEGERKWPWGFLTGGLLTALVVGLFDQMLHIIWPESLISSWLFG